MPSASNASSELSLTISEFRVSLLVLAGIFLQELGDDVCDLFAAEASVAHGHRLTLASQRFQSPLSNASFWHVTKIPNDMEPVSGTTHGR